MITLIIMIEGLLVAFFHRKQKLDPSAATTPSLLQCWQISLTLSNTLTDASLQIFTKCFITITEFLTHVVEIVLFHTKIFNECCTKIFWTSQYWTNDFGQSVVFPFYTFFHILQDFHVTTSVYEVFPSR